VERTHPLARRCNLESPGRGPGSYHASPA